MSIYDKEYFCVRAESELQMAKAAQNPAAKRAHYTLAGHYLNRAHGGQLRNLPASPAAKSCGKDDPGLYSLTGS
ncbi:hypothetical protein [uncultured Sphingomonas sp.]|jgi:hypothetical protein|uniref:hypothetical protein n=1 Tax=uncultured Sphingomonas sp. TaxID=158754 RepID=UPI0025D694DC|nr:hypothetical protein [uncultured Sphingomonas sp.]